jgi:5-formyltetrahydrofolate cyclo-ligase
VTEADARRALRELMRARRQALPVPIRLAAAEGLARQLRGLEPLRRAARVAGYWAVRGEMPLHALFAPPPPFDYCLPCLTDAQDLRFARWRPGEPVQANRFGIPEPQLPAAQQWQPEALDAVLVPLLAFDRHGNRLGSGAGYYDRSFAFLGTRRPRPAPLLIGVAYAMQEVERLAIEPWDVPLDYIATEAELIECEFQ